MGNRSHIKTSKDVFISHSGKDKSKFIHPLTDALIRRGIECWLDEIEISWGDSITAGINKGLRDSRYVLLCLSRNFLHRNWPEDELSSMLAVQNQTGTKRILPLILNSKDKILKTYPLLSDKSYRIYKNPETVATELAILLEKEVTPPETITITFESAHSERSYEVPVSPRISVANLTRMAMEKFELPTVTEVSNTAVFHLRWVLVDVKAESAWLEMPRQLKQEAWAVVSAVDGVKVSKSPTDRIGELGIDTDTVFHIAVIEDIFIRREQQQLQQQQER